MRHKSFSDLPLFESAKYDVYGRLYVGGVLLADLLGQEPLRAATWGASVDQLVGSGEITISRKVGSAEISPFDPGALGDANPEPGNSFMLQTATIPKGATPTEDDFVTVFDGEIDTVDNAGEALVLGCRDGFCRYADTIIEPPSEAPYVWPISSSTMGVVLTAIANLGEAGPDPIIGLGDPDWTVIAYGQQAGISKAEAMHAVVLQRGWAIHYRYWRGDLKAIGSPVYYDPERGGPTTPSANYVVQQSEIIRYSKCRLDRSRVRNAIELIYGAERTRIAAEDADSIAAYGRRYMLLSEDATSQIDTEVEAERMLEAALADQKDAGAEIDYERFYFWGVELADLHTIIGSPGRHPTIDVGVIGYTQSLDFSPGGRFRTTIRTASRSAGARVRWRKVDPRMVHVSLGEPVGFAPEGAVWYQVDSLDIPTP